MVSCGTHALQRRAQDIYCRPLPSLPNRAQGRRGGGAKGVYVPLDTNHPRYLPSSLHVLFSRNRYALQLSAKPPPSSSSLRFESPLGATQSEAFVMKVFNSSAAEPVEFECSLEGGNETHFRVPPKVHNLFLRVGQSICPG